MAFKMKGHALPGFKQRTVSTISDSLDTAYDDKYENIFSNISDDLDAKIDSINTAKQAEIDALTNIAQSDLETKTDSLNTAKTGEFDTIINQGHLKNISPNQANKEIKEFNEKNK